jgi:hypothetical protein
MTFSDAIADNGLDAYSEFSCAHGLNTLGTVPTQGRSPAYRPLAC